MAKKIGIISDTHGVLRDDVMEILKDCDIIIHAGDFDRGEILDRLRYMGNVYAVRGNNDGEWANGLKKSLRFSIDGANFFMTHNRKDVSWELGDTDIVIFGHTHRYFEEKIDGRLWLNPGSCGRPRFGGELSMVVMNISDGEYSLNKIMLFDEKGE